MSAPNGGPEPAPNLYLVGFMGTGKSLLGRRLSHHLRLRFLDSDRVIEARAGRGSGGRA